MRVFFVGRNYSQGLKDSDPTSLMEVAKSIGMERAYSLSENPDLLICVDYKNHVLPLVKRASRLGIPTVLIINEPTVVVPQHSNPRVIKAFDRVVRVGRPTLPMVLKWPQTWREEQTEMSRENKAVVVNADKWSFVSGQLYWLRAAISAKNEDVVVYGHGWDRGVLLRLAHRSFELLRTIGAGARPNLKGLASLVSTPRNYMGKTEDKIATMSKYKVALVIENSKELMTEKLFDAWFAGCIPVYIGPPLASFGIPETLAISCSDSSIASVDKAMAQALQADGSIFRSAIREFLDQPESESWKSHTAMTNILRESYRPQANQ